MLEVKENVDSKDYSTFKIGGKFRYFTEISYISNIVQACEFAKDTGIKVFVLGGGSNVVFSNGIINVLAMKMEIKGFEIVNETNEHIDIKIGAGEIWDEVVAKTIEINLAGFESMSAIPGTVGAVPVQNVGAYGSEVKDLIISVEVFDIEENKIISLSNIDCKFGYRDSIFKNEAKGKYIITAVIFRLNKTKDNILLKQKRTEIIKIRQSKLPDPKEIPNVGSFFKNPIVKKELFLAISRTYGEIPHFDLENNLVKVPAGWLIEQAGLKGKSFGNISVYEKNALVLINNGKATKDELIKVKNEIVKIIHEKFEIILEQEPETI